MIRALRLVWPPWWALFWAGLVCAAVEAFYRFLEWRFDARVFSEFGDKPGTVAILSLCASLYAVYRVWTFHPVLRPGYYQWMASTPWTRSHPLPLGPIHLAWQDLLLLGIGVAASWPRLQTQALIPVQAFLFVYLAALAATHCFTETSIWSYGMGIGLSFMVLFLRNPTFYAAAAAITYGIAYLGLRSALARFPWQDSIVGRHRDATRRNQPLGWPYDRLGPPRSPGGMPELPGHVMFALGLMLGWWFYVFGTYGVVDMPFYPTVLILAVMRLFVYCNGYLPPISFLGRLTTGRWIIPAYDQVFVAPALVVMVGVATWFVLHRTTLTPAIVQPIALTLAFWITFGVGPSPRAWQLTGNHRIVKGLMFQARR